MGEIARGGMGSVFRGRDPDLGHDLALKVLLDQHCEQLDLVNRFLEEAQICGQLQHPGVVPVYDLGTLVNHRPFFAMKLVKGRTMAELLAARSSPVDDLPRFLSIFEAVCQTMAYAHARGVIHRDLKPANVMVGSFGEVQVMDWGLAKVMPKDRPKQDIVARPANDTIVSTIRSEAPTELTRTGSVMGTPAYMAPEQARGETGTIDRRADVFSLGSILCVILTGEPVFSSNTSIDIVRAAGRAETGAALARLAHCGAEEELLALTRDCLAPEPKDRPADAGLVAGRMTAYLAGVQERLHEAEVSRAAENARAEEAEAKAASERHTRQLTAALAATVLLAGLLGGAGWRCVELKRLERVREASGRVNVALQAATRLRGLAQGAAVGDLGPWELAAGGVEKARELLEPGVEPVLRKQVENLRAEVIAERSRPRRPPRRPIVTDDCWTAWWTSAVPRPTTRAAGAPTQPTPRLSARRGSMWRPCPRTRRPGGSRPARPRWSQPWRRLWMTGPPFDAIGRRTPPARRLCRPWPAPSTLSTGGLACAVPWTCPPQPLAWRRFEVWLKPRRSRLWGPSALTSWAAPSGTRATRPVPRRCCGGPSSFTPETSGSTQSGAKRWSTLARRSRSTPTTAPSAPRWPWPSTA